MDGRDGAILGVVGVTFVSRDSASVSDEPHGCWRLKENRKPNEMAGFCCWWFVVHRFGSRRSLVRAEASVSTSAVRPIWLTPRRARIAEGDHSSAEGAEDALRDASQLWTTETTERSDVNPRAPRLM